MITDPLTPVYGELGAGTVVTMGGQKILGDGMQFNVMQSEIYTEYTAEQYRIMLDGRRILFVAADTMLYTEKGFMLASSIINSYATLHVRCLKFRCLTCQQWYLPLRPIWSFCNVQCAKIGNFVTPRRAINKNTLPLCAKEEWTPIRTITRVQFTKGTEAVRIAKMETGNSIYANNILISGSHLLS